MSGSTNLTCRSNTSYLCKCRRFRTLRRVTGDVAGATGAPLQGFGAFADRYGGYFTRQPQRAAASQYFEGLLDGSERKSMQATQGRLMDPVSYKALHYFIMHSPWEARMPWTRDWTAVPERTGIVVVDDTIFPKQS